MTRVRTTAGARQAGILYPSVFSVLAVALVLAGLAVLAAGVRLKRG